MRFRALLFAAILAAGAAWAQNDQPKPAPAPTPAPAAQPSTPANPAAPATDDKPAAPAPGQQQNQPPVTPDQAQPADASDQPKSPQPQIKHDGGKNDVDAIGGRKVGGFDMYSIDTDIKIGKAYSQQIERSVKIIDDPVVNEFVNRLGQNLVRNSDAKVPFVFKIVDADEINALTLPGGFVYINSGMILAADDEAELAGGMAHEIAHVALRHGTRMMTRANIAQIASIPAMILIPVPVNVPGLVLPGVFLKFSRDFEAEADYFGVQYMYKAGYDPNGLVTFFEKVEAREKKKPGTMAKAFSTHPQTPDRIQKSQHEIGKILAPRDSYIETTSEFADVRARLAMLENRRKMDDANQDKPALRRASDPGDSDKNGDRPTLKHPDQRFAVLGVR